MQVINFESCPVGIKKICLYREISTSIRLYFGNNVNEGKYQVAVWADKRNPVKSLMLHPRVDKNMTTEVKTLWAFPKEYDIFKTNLKNTRWRYLGRYKTQPVEVTIDKNGKKTNKVFSAKIDFNKKITTWGFLIKPVILGKDKHGGNYFHLG